MSLHGAKGLEFRYVFIVGVEDGTLPHEAASKKAGRRRAPLLYVGITRAKEGCSCRTRARPSAGRQDRLRPSRFFEELPAAEIQRDGADPVADAARKQERASAGFAAIRALLDAP